MDNFPHGEKFSVSPTSTALYIFSINELIKEAIKEYPNFRMVLRTSGIQMSCLV